MATTVYSAVLRETTGDQAITPTKTSGTAVTAMTITRSEGGDVLTITCTT
jgi:hypothetical protein